MILLKHLFKNRTLVSQRSGFWFATKAHELVRDTCIETQNQIGKNRSSSKIASILSKGADKIANVPSRDKQIFYKLVIHLGLNKRIPQNDVIEFGNKYFGEYPHLQIETLNLKLSMDDKAKDADKLMNQIFQKLQEVKDERTKMYYEQQANHKMAEICVKSKKYNEALEYFEKTLKILEKLLNQSVTKYTARIQELQKKDGQSEAVEIQINGLKTLLKGQIQAIGLVSRQAFKLSQLQKKQQLKIKFLKIGLQAFEMFPAVKESSSNYMFLESSRLYSATSLARTENETAQLIKQANQLLKLAREAVRKIESPIQKLDSCACALRMVRLLSVLQGKRNQIAMLLTKEYEQLRANLSANDLKQLGQHLENLKDVLIKTQQNVDVLNKKS